MVIGESEIDLSISEIQKQTLHPRLCSANVVVPQTWSIQIYYLQVNLQHNVASKCRVIASRTIVTLQPSTDIK